MVGEGVRGGEEVRDEASSLNNNINALATTRRFSLLVASSDELALSAVFRLEYDALPSGRSGRDEE